MSDGPIGSQLDRLENKLSFVMQELVAVHAGQGVLCERLDALKGNVLGLAGLQGKTQAELSMLKIELVSFKDNYDWDLLVDVNFHAKQLLDALAAAKNPAKRR